MIAIEEALSLVLELARPKGPTRVPVSLSLGLVLAEDVASDIDSPPHDKSIVDGYAIQAKDLAAGSAILTVLEEVMAGDVPSREVSAGTATRIMTGAPVSLGSDAVVMVENTELVEPDRVSIRQDGVSSGQNIMRRATSLAQGDVVLRIGHELRPIEIGLLSEVGRDKVLAVPRPTIAVLATGNELVAASERPQAGQIRNSNGPMICALVDRAGAVAADLGIARDTKDDLRRLIAEGLTHDVLVLSGGVSAGVLDLVPSVLTELGVEQVFHKVSLKPGKPLWFGVCDHDDRRTLVFGLPGNPVSSLVCFELFTRSAIDALVGRSPQPTNSTTARLTRQHKQRGNRPIYWPSVLREDETGRSVEPLQWMGSADLRSLVDANCLSFFPAGDRSFLAGEEVDVRLF